MDDQARCIYLAQGEMEAQQIRSFLAASGIATTVRGETLRNTHGLTLDGLAAVQIFVAARDEDRAKTLLASAEAGAFRLDDADP